MHVKRAEFVGLLSQECPQREAAFQLRDRSLVDEQKTQDARLHPVKRLAVQILNVQNVDTDLGPFAQLIFAVEAPRRC